MTNENPVIHLCLVLHNHQPVGNFDDVYESAYQDSYLPFLDEFEPYEHLRISLHTSGPLAKWLQVRHPDYMKRLSDLVIAGRIEIIGGAFYEPILSMIPSCDRRGQISQYTQWLSQNLGGEIRGIWIPERVWESEFTSDIADAGIRYTILDDYHFRRAGLQGDELSGYFITENEGRTLRVFPGSETLRYLIPFREPIETIEHCRQLARQRPGSVIVFGDDGEKFGTWPETKKHVYEQGWLRKFFDALTENRDWLKTETMASVVSQTPPIGKIYLPDASYREMTEWAMPVARQLEFEKLVHEFEGDERFERIKPLLSGGFWRNFKVKYPESNEMYARMMYVSRLLAGARECGINETILHTAQDHLYQGQCNCSYWHGAFGGIYLPHLRNAVYQQLIMAENLLQQAMRRPVSQWIECTDNDFNFDGQNEVRLANDKIVAWVIPHQGGYLYELDVRDIGHNLLATMQRRPEAYHEKVRRGQAREDDHTASIHDRVVFKQEGLERCLNYDDHPRKSLVDHFWDDDTNIQSVVDGTAEERGDFVQGYYSAAIRRNPQRIQVVLKRNGIVSGIPIAITKGVTLNAGSSQLEIAYLLEGLPQNKPLHFATEFNFSGMPEGQDDRFFSDANDNPIGQLGSMLDLKETRQLKLTDRWLGLCVQLDLDRPANIWTFPIHSVSQSESGFELVHQSIVVQPHWAVCGDQHGRWATKMFLSMDLLSENQREDCDEMIAASH